MGFSSKFRPLALISSVVHDDFAAHLFVLSQLGAGGIEGLAHEFQQGGIIVVIKVGRSKVSVIFLKGYKVNVTAFPIHYNFLLTLNQTRSNELLRRPSFSISIPISSSFETNTIDVTAV